MMRFTNVGSLNATQLNTVDNLQANPLALSLSDTASHSLQSLQALSVVQVSPPPKQPAPAFSAALPGAKSSAASVNRFVVAPIAQADPAFSAALPGAKSSAASVNRFVVAPIAQADPAFSAALPGAKSSAASVKRFVVAPIAQADLSAGTPLPPISLPQRKTRFTLSKESPVESNFCCRICYSTIGYGSYCWACTSPPLSPNPLAPALGHICSSQSLQLLDDHKQDCRFVGQKLLLAEAHNSDLKECLGLDNTKEFGLLMQNPLKSMKQEWHKNGSKTDIANYNYVTISMARKDEDIPEHVKRTFHLGVYHGGPIVEADYDTDHDNMDLQDFVDHDISLAAGLKAHHCASLRLYTSDSFILFNRPIRNGTKPHPIRVTMYVLDEALRKLRKVEAFLDKEAYAKTLYLWRGMKDLHMDVAEFQKCGGTELAPMSTTKSRDVANLYARGTAGGLLFRFSTKAHSRGVSIDYLSLYPKEKEYLYPPLTYVHYDEHSEGVVTEENGIKIVPVCPQMA